MEIGAGSRESLNSRTGGRHTKSSGMNNLIESSKLKEGSVKECSRTNCQEVLGRERKEGRLWKNYLVELLPGNELVHTAETGERLTLQGGKKWHTEGGVGRSEIRGPKNKKRERTMRQKRNREREMGQLGGGPIYGRRRREGGKT